MELKAEDFIIDVSVSEWLQSESFSVTEGLVYPRESWRYGSVHLQSENPEAEG